MSVFVEGDVVVLVGFVAACCEYKDLAVAGGTTAGVTGPCRSRAFLISYFLRATAKHNCSVQ